jgi:PAS domain S-box-containing protein
LGIGRDTTTQNVLKSEVEEKQLQLSAILDNMPFFVCMKDINGKIVRSNKQSVELHGLEPENMIGLNAKDLFPQEIAEEFLNDDKKVIENKEIIVKEIQFKTPSGIKWIESNRRPILDDYGNVQGIIIINKDINLLKEVAAQKETFVATLTHDLKVPTIAQIKALEIILNGSVGKLPQEQSEVLGQILNSCRYMLNMISTLLSTYRYEDGIKKINYEEFDFINLVSECCNEIACLAKEKEQKITIKNNSVENLICADKLEIKRVVTNLIANAISYSRKNSPIEISMEDSNHETIFLVNSHNKIIPKAQLEKLFDKYVSDASKYRKSGIGLGLYLTKQIITAHKGEVIAESDEINGNTFGFKIPKINLKTIIAEELSNSVAQNNL